MPDFGNILKKLRKEKKITQTQLANALGLAFSTISMYERNEREPDFEILEAIADYFNVSMDYLHGKSFTSDSLTDKEQSLLRSFRKLNNNGQDAAIAMVSGLTTQEIYKKSENNQVSKLA